MKFGYYDYDYDGKRQGNIGGDMVFKLFSEHVDISRFNDAAHVNKFDVVLYLYRPQARW